MRALRPGPSRRNRIRLEQQGGHHPTRAPAGRRSSTGGSAGGRGARASRTPPPSRLIASLAPNEISSRASSGRSSPRRRRCGARRSRPRAARLADAERAGGSALRRDVGVELPGAGGEALAVLAVDDERPPLTAGPAWTRSPPGRRASAGAARAGRRRRRGRGAPAAHGGRSARARPGRRRPNLAERPVRVAHEEAGHDRLGMAVRGAPEVEPLRLREADDAHPRRAARMADEVDRRLEPVSEPRARVRIRRPERPEQDSNLRPTP